MTDRGRLLWLMVGLLLGSAAVGSYVAFLSGWWIPVVPPVLALTGSAIAVTAYIARSAGDIRKDALYCDLGAGYVPLSAAIYNDIRSGRARF